MEIVTGTQASLGVQAQRAPKIYLPFQSGELVDLIFQNVYVTLHIRQGLLLLLKGAAEELLRFFQF